MSTFDELSIKSKRFLDYLIHLEMESWPGEPENVVISRIFEEIELTKHEYFLEDEFIYAEKLKITRKLIRERMREISRNGGFANAKGIV